jgi:hypothetical protein
MTQVDSLMVVRNINMNAFNRYAVMQLYRITNAGAEAFYHFLVKNSSYALFILMPLFAMLLRVFYRKQSQFYIESLIHSLHIHTFGFLLLTLYLIISKIFSSLFILLGLTFILIFYLHKSQQKVFGQRRLITIMKTIVIIVLYILSILCTMFLTIMTIVLIF